MVNFTQDAITKLGDLHLGYINGVVCTQEELRRIRSGHLNLSDQKLEHYEKLEALIDDIQTR